MALNHIFPKWYYSETLEKDQIELFDSSFDTVIDNDDYIKQIDDHRGQFNRIDTTHHDPRFLYPWNNMLKAYATKVGESIGVAEDDELKVLSCTSWIGKFAKGDYLTRHDNVSAFSNVTLVYFHKLDPVDKDKFIFFDNKSLEDAIGLSNTFDNEELSSDVFIPEIEQGMVLIFPSSLQQMINKLESDNTIIFQSQLQFVPKFIHSGEYFVRNDNSVIILPDGTRA